MPKAQQAPAPPTLDSLLDKGDGVLNKRNGVWTYPGCENDLSGTNLVMPTEFVPDSVVQQALSKGDLVPKATDLLGGTVAVTRAPEEGETVRVVNMAAAGTVEAATELPPNSRPTHDAGRDPRPVDVARAQSIIEAGKIAVPVPAPRPSGPVAPAGAAVPPPAAGEPKKS